MTHAEVGGETAPAFDGVCEAFIANLAGGQEVGAAVGVYLHGRKVVDLWGGTGDPGSGRSWQRDSTAVIYSATKGITAVCADFLAQRGDLDLDAPVAAYRSGSASAAQPETAMRERSRSPDVVPPFAMGFFAYPPQIGQWRTR